MGQPTRKMRRTDILEEIHEDEPLEEFHAKTRRGRKDAKNTEEEENL
jgi:hypothetical protein